MTKILTPGHPPIVKDLEQQDHDITILAGHEADWYPLVGVLQGKLRVELEGTYKQLEGADFEVDYVGNRVKFLAAAADQTYSLMYMSLV